MIFLFYCIFVYSYIVDVTFSQVCPDDLFLFYIVSKICSLDPYGLFASYVDAAHISSLCIIWILNMVWIPPFTRHWISAFYSTHFMRYAHLGEELILYWLFRFFVHFGNCWQWGRSLECLREMVLCLSLVCAWVFAFHAYLSLIDVLHGLIYSVNSTKG